MAASHFLDGSIARRHLSDSVSLDLATKKKPGTKKKKCPLHCDTTATSVKYTKAGRCDDPKRKKKRPSPKKK